MAVKVAVSENFYLSVDLFRLCTSSSVAFHYRSMLARADCSHNSLTNQEPAATGRLMVVEHAHNENTKCNNCQQQPEGTESKLVELPVLNRLKVSLSDWQIIAARTETVS